MARLVKVLMAGIRTGDAPVSAGLVYTYTTGTTTPATYLYSDNGLSSAHANPATLDADGRLEAYCSDTATFRIVVKDSTGTTTIVDVDPAESSSTALTSAIVVDTTNDDALTGGAGSLLSTWMGFIWGTLNGSSAAATAKDLKYLHTGTGAVGRTLRARLSDCFNVMDFGAAGTGSTDDEAAIQAAVDAAAAAGGGVVYVPGNIYRCANPIAIASKDNVSIIGDGPGSIIRASFSSDALIKITGTSDAIEISSLQLQGGGGSGTTTAIGISVASGIPADGGVPVNIHSVVFSGASDGTGFNVGVEALGTRGSVSNCFFQRIYGTDSRAVRTNTGSGWSITNCHVRGVDAASGRTESGFGNSSSGGDDTRIVGCHVNGTSGAGIRFAGSDGVVITGNRIDECQGAGIALVSTTGSAVYGNACHGNQYGVLVSSSGAAAPSGFTISGNSLQSNTVDGVRLSNSSSASASYTPRNGTVSGNTIRLNTQAGVALVGADKCLVSCNQISDNGSNGNYPAIDVTTDKPSATDYGGFYNMIANNLITDTSGSVHSSAIRIQGSGGGNANNVSSTFVVDNKLSMPAGGSNWLVYGLTTSSPLMSGNVSYNGSTGYGSSEAYYHMSSSTTVPTAYSHGVITNKGATGAVTATMFALSSPQTDGLRFTFIRYASQNFTIASSDTIKYRNGTSSDVTLTSATDQIVHMVSMGTTWYCDVVDYS